MLVAGNHRAVQQLHQVFVAELQAQPDFIEDGVCGLLVQQQQFERCWLVSVCPCEQRKSARPGCEKELGRSTAAVRRRPSCCLARGGCPTLTCVHPAIAAGRDQLPCSQGDEERGKVQGRVHHQAGGLPRWLGARCWWLIRPKYLLGKYPYQGRTQAADWPARVQHAVSRHPPGHQRSAAGRAVGQGHHRDGCKAPQAVESCTPRVESQSDGRDPGCGGTGQRCSWLEKAAAAIAASGLPAHGTITPARAVPKHFTDSPTARLVAVQAQLLLAGPSALRKL